MSRSLLIDRIRTLSQPLSLKSTSHSTKLAPLRGVRCVAFDFYGTMFISGVGDIGIDEEKAGDSDILFEEALRDTGFILPRQNVGSEGLRKFKKVIEQTMERGHREGIEYPEPDIVKIWQKVLKELEYEGIIAGEVTSASATRFGIEFEFRINNIWPVPHLRQTLKTLLEKGLKLGIISNSQFYTPMAFEAILGKDPVAFGFDPDLLIWSYAFGFKKPSIEFYRQFTGRLPEKNLSPSEVLYIGNDLGKDIQPAQSLGMKTGLFVGDRRSIRHDAPELEDASAQPDIIIDDLRQIVECL